MAEKDEEKKGFFEKAGDLFSNRDEKEAAEAAEKRAKEAEARAREMEAKLKTSAENAKKLVEENRLKELAEKKREELQRKTQATKDDVADRWKNQVEAAKTRAAAQPKYIAEHTVAKGETLSHVALKHYGSAGEAYWRHIYEANKATIGDNPGFIRSGVVLNIPELPENLKK